jgi:hypothetical protein
MRPLNTGYDLTHGTLPTFGPTLSSQAWGNNTFNGLAQQLDGLTPASTPNQIIDVATDIIHYFNNPANRPNRAQLADMFTLIGQTNRPILWYAYALGLHERSSSILGGRLQNLYSKTLKNVPAPPLQAFVQQAVQSQDKGVISGLRAELVHIRRWVMQHPHVFGSGHQSHLSDLLHALQDPREIKQVFVGNAVLAEIGEALSGLRNGSRFLQRAAQFFSRGVIT